MTTQKRYVITTSLMLLAGSLAGFMQTRAIADGRSAEMREDRPQVEPNAGSWKTWVISSGRDYRVPPPPGRGATRMELRALEELIGNNDAQAQQQVTFWDAGAPGYRWMDMINGRAISNLNLTPFSFRVYTYVAQAMYDATIAAWDSKYYYNRPRPSELDHDLPTAVAVPNSPSYPSEHAAAAQAAASVLGYLFPADAQAYQTLAEQAGWSRVLAGVQYPSDYYAGLDLGRKVAEQVIAKAKLDGSDAVWGGTVPTGPCKWLGSNPANVTVANFKPILLNSPSQFRCPAPPACDSPEGQAQVAAVLNFPRTFVTTYKAFYWQSPDGLSVWPFRYADTYMFENKMQNNPPRAARVYALLASGFFDVFITSQDSKFTYWYIRPPQLEPAIKPLFAVPNFPSYPSNHATVSTLRAELLAYLFPDKADVVRAIGKEAGDSRVWAGIHYPMDLEAGVNLGHSVAQVFLNWAQNDGSQ